MEYKLVSKGAFENIEKFEKRLNGMAVQGWRVITNMTQGAYLILEKKK